MDNFKNRLKNEYRELNDRLTKLTAFMARPKAKAAVGDTQYEMLGHQKKAMQQYQDILERRLTDLGEDIQEILDEHQPPITRESVLAKAVDDCLCEMYERAQPSDSYPDLCTEYEMGQLDDEKHIYDYYYLSEDEYVYIKEKYKNAYNIRATWRDNVNLVIENLQKGGLKNTFVMDEHGLGHREAENIPPLAEQIGQENADNVIATIEDIRDFYRFDREETSFDFTIGLGSASPSSSKERVVESWKRLGVSIEIEDRDPLTFWDIDEYGNVIDEEDEIEENKGE